MIVYIDGDVLAYRAAFSAEMVKWGIIDEDGECYIHCNSKEQALELAVDGEHVERTAEPLPFERAILHLQNDIQQIVKNCCAHLDADRIGVVIYMSHPDKAKNDRYAIAKTVPYKGNRKQRAPFHKKAILNYMTNMENTITVEGIEADDALCTSMFNTPGSICASIDKDLLMVPGIHYNFNAKDFVLASDPGMVYLKDTKSGKKLVGYGFIWFCAQMIIGDPVDNIVGLRGYGPVKAHKLLHGIGVQSIGNLWRLVKNEYAMEGELDRVFENADLLWIRRNEDETFREWLKTNGG